MIEEAATDPTPVEDTPAVEQAPDPAPEPAPASAPEVAMPADATPIGLVNERITDLEAKVQTLWNMVVFLKENPNWTVADYLNGATLPVGFER